MLSILITLIIVGILLYLVQAYIPMDPRIKNIIYIVVVIFLILWLASALFGFTTPVTPRL